MDTRNHNPTPRAARRGGFSLVELMIAVIILAFGVLGLAATTAFIVRQITLSDVNTERSAALQGVVERIRSTTFNSVGSGSQTIGSYSVTWSVTDSTTVTKTVRVITRGPGLNKDTTVSVVPMLAANVQDTFTMIVLRP
jgi:prepilin-type N-terminal cleavage/methylation domain-containing protein